MIYIDKISINKLSMVLGFYPMDGCEWGEPPETGSGASPASSVPPSLSIDVMGPKPNGRVRLVQLYGW